MIAAASAAARRIEVATHMELKDCGVHLHGEWFDITAKDALKAIEVTAKKNKAAAIGVDVLLGAVIKDFSPRREVDAVKEYLVKDMLAVNEYVIKTRKRVVSQFENGRG